ncbi:MAG: type II secretion system protein [Bacillota bacterium]
MKGFTLIETILYIALMGLILSTVFVGSYDLIQESQKRSIGTTLQEEGLFVVRKLDWAMHGMTVTPTVGGSTCDGTLTLTPGGAADPVIFRKHGSAIEMCEDSTCTYTPITTNNVSVTCFNVSAIAASGSGPAGVAITATMESPTAKSQDFTITRYVRQ